MRFCRFVTPTGAAWGRIREDQVEELGPEGEILAEHALAGLPLLAPAEGCRIFGIGRNYKAHIEELNPGWEQESPLVFMKPDTSLCGHRDAILLPRDCPGPIDYEGELAVVIGRQCRRISRSDSASVIAGYTIANDISARELQKSDGQWTRAKGFDTFCPLGPWIERDLDSAKLQLSTRLNGKVVQQGNTAQMIRDVAELVSYLSSFCTLNPGDLVLTGTPSGVGPLSVGDTVSVEIEGIGMLENTVEAEQ